MSRALERRLGTMTGKRVAVDAGKENRRHEESPISPLQKLILSFSLFVICAVIWIPLSLVMD